MPTASTDQFYAALPGAVARIVGGTSHVAGVMHAGELERAAPHARSGFSPLTRQILVPQDAHGRLEAFFEPTNVRAINRNESAERFQLAMLKSDLLRTVHATLHGVGPADPNLMAVEWASYWRYPHTHALAEGVAEASAQLIVNRTIQSLGLDAVDPRILEVTPLQTAFHGPTTLIQALTRDVAGAVGSDPAAELLDMARWGGGQLSLWRLAVRWGVASEFGEPERLTGAGAIVGMRQGLEGAIASAVEEWAAVAPEQDTPDLDSERALHYAERARRDVHFAVRHWLAGEGGLPDPARFAAELAKAGEAAQGELNSTMDQVQNVWDMLEAGLDMEA